MFSTCSEKGMVECLHYSLNIMLRVSFSLGRERACRHCWISSFRTPRENGYYTLSM